MDHAGEELERGAKLLCRPVARADDQARKVSIMQSRILLRGYAREGEMPLPLQPIPNNKTNTKIKVVYTEELTDPGGLGYCAYPLAFHIVKRVLIGIAIVITVTVVLPAKATRDTVRGVVIEDS